MVGLRPAPHQEGIIPSWTSLKMSTMTKPLHRLHKANDRPVAIDPFLEDFGHEKLLLSLLEIDREGK